MLPLVCVCVCPVVYPLFHLFLVFLAMPILLGMLRDNESLSSVPIDIDA